MPRFLRIFLTGLSFAIFFGGSIGIGVALFPLLFLFALGNPKRYRERNTRLVGWGYGTFLFWMRLIGLIDWQGKVEVPESLKGKPFVVVANHPTLIDVIFFLNAMRKLGLTCVVKHEWYHSFVFGAVLRGTTYVASPSPAESALGGQGLDRLVAHVQSGRPLMIFPEGTRSAARKLRRFRRGAFEIAKRCEVPIVRYFIAVDRPMLMKGVPFWKVPEDKAAWRFELLEVIDTATDPRSAKELAEDSQADYEQRFAQWVASREQRHFASQVDDAQAESAPAP
ncbi:MAG: 1-acyl-sn-glycerol-3-phosphate acyltransferase [Sandaracinus sp.]|nr:1-acyl-sn-glycerol-3-phosphate acyltransferase [Sandaracinus sp.]MCB9611595.1 1-acyl-sn-glycerol-3-phosphate acyltransferase [Sandaracinus sp.]MCB9636074.1 1-acyl-sn-glycerol-3-phosphate acyltransferase [Sandaracinus sp.]